MRTNRRGVTIIEFLVILLILGLLAALLVPATRTAREPARRTQCKNNLKNVGLALHNAQETGGSTAPANPIGSVENLPPFLGGRGPVEVDHVDLVEHPERYTGENRPWWLVEGPVAETPAQEPSL